jgi:hypothetical protein
MYNPSGASGMMPYGMRSSGNAYGGSPGSGSYGGGNQGASGYANPYQPDAPMAATTRTATVLESFGVATEGGEPAWPLGLRILAPAAEARVLRHQVNALLVLMSTARADGSANPEAAQEANHALARLRVLLADQQAGMAEATYDQAAHFLKKLQRAFKALQQHS